jgi:hypothetical protein
LAVCVCNSRTNHGPSHLEHSRHLHGTNHTLQAAWSMQYLSVSMKKLRSYCRNCNTIYYRMIAWTQIWFWAKQINNCAKSSKRNSVLTFFNS